MSKTVRAAHAAHTPDGPRRVLIVGCGYLGRRAADAWIQSGVRVWALTRSPDRARAFRNGGIHSLVGSVTADLPKLPDVDTVLWCVGFDRGAGASREAVWLNGLQNLLNSLPDTVRRVLYTSSTAVYGQTEGETVTECSQTEPLTEGGRCCLQAEQLLSAAAGCDVSILRLGGIYGPDRLLRRIDALRQSQPVPGSPASRLNLIHVDDAVTAIMHVAGRRDVPLINVVAAEAVTRGEYYRELARLTQSPLPVFAEHDIRERGGNKRVVSVVRPEIGLSYRFDDVAAGLCDAVNRSHHGPDTDSSVAG